MDREEKRKEIEQLGRTPFGRHYADAHGRIVSDAIFVIDLLTGLRHFCDGHWLDFSALDRMAYGRYLEDLGERRSRWA